MIDEKKLHSIQKNELEEKSPFEKCADELRSSMGKYLEKDAPFRIIIYKAQSCIRIMFPEGSMTEDQFERNILKAYPSVFDQRMPYWQQSDMLSVELPLDYKKITPDKIKEFVKAMGVGESDF